VRTRAARGFSHNLCSNQPFACYIYQNQNWSMVGGEMFD
jgi:hypothetical protein